MKVTSDLLKKFLLGVAVVLSIFSSIISVCALNKINHIPLIPPQHERPQENHEEKKPNMNHDEKAKPKDKEKNNDKRRPEERKEDKKEEK